MTVRDMIEQLQRFDQNFRVVVENDIPIAAHCTECGEEVRSVNFQGAVDRVSVAGGRCEVVIDFV
jgi:hypothetical protein